METFSIAEKQPYIFRLTRLGVDAAQQGHGLEFTAAISKLIFGGTRGWNKPELLAAAAHNAGLNLAEMDARISSNPDYYDTEIAANEQALEEAGHWGVPTLVVRDEPFFGQDRIDDFIWRLEQLGITQSSR
jgi:2-hydroxychromene-2-carboxylate isomerase